MGDGTARHARLGARRRLVAAGAVALLGALYLLNASWLAAPLGDRPFLLAHRGLGQAYDRTGLTGRTCTAARLLVSGHDYLENTIPSMAAAFDFGASIVEFDVHPTTDGDFAVFHDATLDCRTEATGRPRDRTLAELKALDVGHGYTADGGQSWPFRGRGMGLMPSLGDVLTAFPGRDFLIDMKQGDAEIGERLGRALTRLRGDGTGRILLHGSPAAVAAARTTFPGAIPVTRRSLKRCLLRYVAVGWSGHVPRDCRGTLLTIPANVAPWLWGWPNRLLRRMDAVGTRVVVLGDYGGEGFSTPFDDPSRLTELPADYAGGIWTDRIDLLGPAIDP